LETEPNQAVEQSSPMRDFDYSHSFKNEHWYSSKYSI